MLSTGYLAPVILLITFDPIGQNSRQAKHSRDIEKIEAVIELALLTAILVDRYRSIFANTLNYSTPPVDCS